MTHSACSSGVSEESVEALPVAFSLSQDYPNPFNPSSTLRYAVPRRSHVTLAVFDMRGQYVSTLVNDEVEAGYHEVQLHAAGLASGVYLNRMKAGDFVQVRKLCFIR